MGHDVLFNLHKPGPTRKPAIQPASDNGELEHLVLEAVQEHLRTLPDRIKANSV